VREHERGADVPGQLAEVAVVPGGLDAAEDPRRVLLAVPAEPEAVAVRLFGAEPRVEALDDQRVLAVVEQLLDEDRRTRICEPATDAVIVVARKSRRLIPFGRCRETRGAGG